MAIKLTRQNLTSLQIESYKSILIYASNKQCQYIEHLNGKANKFTPINICQIL